MKTKAKGLEATAAILREHTPFFDPDEFYWYMEIKCVSGCRSDRSYETEWVARGALYRFAKKLGISIESVEVVE